MKREEVLRVANFAVGRNRDRTCPLCRMVTLRLQLYKSSRTNEIQEARVSCSRCAFETYMRLGEVDDELNVDEVLVDSAAAGFASVSPDKL